MASLDYIRDLLDYLEKQDIEYILITLQKNGKSDSDFLIHNFSNYDAKHLFALKRAVEEKLISLNVEESSTNKSKKKKR